jgi:hypothetical protein
MADDANSKLPDVAVTDLTSNANSTCALTAENKVYCWGNGASGQIGNGVIANKTLPDVVSNPYNVTVERLVPDDGGGNAHCYVATNNLLYCWGANNVYQLGNGNNVNSSVPVLSTVINSIENPATPAAPAHIRLGINVTTFSRDLTTLWALGATGTNSINSVKVPPYPNPSPFRTSLTNPAWSVLTPPVDMIKTGMGSCAIKDKSLYCWGTSSFPSGVGTFGGIGKIVFRDTYTYALIGGKATNNHTATSNNTSLTIVGGNLTTVGNQTLTLAKYDQDTKNLVEAADYEPGINVATTLDAPTLTTVRSI